MAMAMAMAIIKPRWRAAGRAAVLIGAMGLAACTHLFVEDCPDQVLGNDTLPRMRTSRYRIQLADTAAAAARFVAPAQMSVLAYHSGSDCKASGESVSDVDAAALVQALGRPGVDGPGWSLAPELGSPGGCEDDTGFMFQVWRRQVAGRDELVLAFRGTGGKGDWLYGNLWWLTRWFIADNQYSRARAQASRVIERVTAEARANGRPDPVVRTTGHSLGGGLAQQVLYAHPTQVLQAIVFDPSSVTGFVDVPKAAQREACACRDELGSEARILRVYESYEVLALLRSFHKAFLPPERHVQELRFPFASTWNLVAQHSIQAFTKQLQAAAAPASAAASKAPWYASADARCTARLQTGQQQSCRAAVGADAFNVCPR
ncbi:MAG: hypothetical protein IPP44_01845 [Ideonella sp.]|nr:hypothetical protein [Ideonella sp.]